MFIYALTPVVATSFPLLTPVIFAAAGALGYKVLTEMKETGGDINKQLNARLTEEIDVTLQLEETILDNLTLEVGREEYLFFEKENVRLMIAKDERGKLKVRVSGHKNADTRDLKRIGEEFVGEIAQQLALNRAIEQMERMNAEVFQEEQTENEDVVLKIRRWT